MFEQQNLHNPGREAIFVLNKLNNDNSVLRCKDDKGYLLHILIIDVNNNILIDIKEPVLLESGNFSLLYMKRS